MAALQQQVVTLQNDVTALMSANQTLLTSLQSAQTQIALLEGRIVTLESGGVGGGVPNLEKYVTIDPNPINRVNGPHIIFTGGVNVHIRSGSGSTDDKLSTGGTLTGLGNLIIGYNETEATTGARTGSHNLVGGRLNTFSSYGGFVFGVQNTISGQYASVVGGDLNRATGMASSVLGGNQNTAAGLNSTVYAGFRNTAINPYSVAPVFTPGG